MNIEKSDVVCSSAGRDKGGYFFVLETDEVYAVIADGKGRRLERPKRKKLKHLRQAGKSDSRTAEKIRNGDKITNSELRRAVAQFAEQSGGKEGGM